MTNKTTTTKTTTTQRRKQQQEERSAKTTQKKHCEGEHEHTEVWKERTARREGDDNDEGFDRGQRSQHCGQGAHW